MKTRKQELEEKELLSVKEFQELQNIYNPFKWKCKCGITCDQPIEVPFGIDKGKKVCPVCFKKATEHVDKTRGIREEIKV